MDEAVSAAAQAAARAGLVADGARALRVGENGVVVLPAAGALARVIPDESQFDHVRHELVVAKWLFSHDVPVVLPLVPAPVLVGGFVVSFWEFLANGGSADLVTLAGCLRRLHAIPTPPTSLLTRLDPFARFEKRVAAATMLDDADSVFLTELRDRLAEQWRRANFDLGEAVIHGDAHMDNLLQTRDGRAAFVDLETVAIGPPEWDLTLTALYHECGWFSASEYANFVDAYGYDVRTSAAWPVLRGIRMVRMTTWLAQSAENSFERETQLRHRLATLRDGTAPAGWTGF
ncbi:phosphotransferase family protein [Micromonospora tarapacensis]|uniref:phosphotransferase family protein n=1 Tax=Micromonospora tarapacensis TaxID=2835305 RepID=UPI001E43C179|nr:aminoglycoside phosphotransferase family protein [Micromonospora tarapacensis]